MTIRLQSRSVAGLTGIFSASCVCLMLGVSLSTRPARACSRPLPPIALQGIPADGDVDVPTDVRPVYDLVDAQLFDLAGQAPQFELTDASGQVVALSPLDSFIWNVELVPASELKPLTRYTLRGTWRQTGVETLADLSLSFTTGAGPLAAAPIPPVASMQHYVFQGVSLTSCDPSRTGTCLALPTGSSVQLTYIDTFGQETGSFATDGRLKGYLVGGPYFTNLSGIDQGTPSECAKLRTRASNGSLSEPLVLCGKDFPAFDIRGSANIACTPAGLTHDGLLAASGLSPNARLRSSESSGCSVASGSPVAAAPIFIVLLGLSLRRRRIAVTATLVRNESGRA